MTRLEGQGKLFPEINFAKGLFTALQNHQPSDKIKMASKVVRYFTRKGLISEEYLTVRSVIDYEEIKRFQVKY